MRAVLVVNPHATSTTRGGRDVLAHSLASETALDVVETTHRGHAAEIAAAAADDGCDIVVAHGGDGTINEVVNGMLARHGVATAPALGVVPGGSANAFARSIGYPRDPTKATHQLLDAVVSGRRHTIGLGLADGRLFTFNAGMGWDADVVAGVDEVRGKATSPLMYTRIATLAYLTPGSGRATLTVDIPGHDSVDVRSAFVSNTDPWTYLGPRPIRLNPGCSFDTGLAIFAPLSLDPISVVGYLRQALSSTGCRGGRRLLHHDDIDKVTVSSENPVYLQVDGDLVGERTSVEFISVPHALRVAV